jgi:hypothetical protein
MECVAESDSKIRDTLTMIPGSEIAKDRYSYQFGKKTKTLGRGHFNNLLTNCRKSRDSV